MLISQHFAQFSAGPSAKPAKVATPPECYLGPVVAVLIESIIWLYTQTSVPCKASQLDLLFSHGEQYSQLDMLVS